MTRIMVNTMPGTYNTVEKDTVGDDCSENNEKDSDRHKLDNDLTLSRSINY